MPPQTGPPRRAQPRWPPLKPPWYRRIGAALRRAARAIVAAALALEGWVRRYFRSHPPTLRWTLAPLILLAVVLYIRHPATNYIFDEQEALLANPYVNAQQKLQYWDAIHRDFWGLPPNASIGSYRPLPNLLWRATWSISEHPFFYHLYNLLFHGLNGALLASFAYAVSRRHLLGWLVGVLFVASAIITEAVSGIVGIADLLGALGAILALCALRLPAYMMPTAVFGACLLGLFSKESALVCVPLVPVAALLTAPALHPRQPARFARFALSFLAAAGAFVLYVELRKQWFPSPLPAELKEALPADAGDMQQLFRDLMVWFHQAPLPKDPLNNPLAKADFPYRFAGALRVYWRGLVQVLWPVDLSGDYSFPQEPIPETTNGWETIAGGLMMLLPLAGALALWIVGLKREYQARQQLVSAGELRTALLDLKPSRWHGSPLVSMDRGSWRARALRAAPVLIIAAGAGLAVELWQTQRAGSTALANTWPGLLGVMVTGFGFLVSGWRDTPKPMRPTGAWPLRLSALWLVPLGLVWMVVSYFPHSNIPVVLPTVRAERFWYFPVIGTAMVLACFGTWFYDRLRHVRIRKVSLGAYAIGTFVLFQAICAYRHSMDYKDDLAFWYATKNTVPNSAKAHLNYSVMVGARGDLETRLKSSHVARKLAPQWPMAHIYTGDTLCRLHRPKEAWPHYAKGFELGPNNRSLISLALQCMYDEKDLMPHETELRALADKHPGSWLALLAIDTLDNHEKHHGVDPQYRPRSYNQKAKDEQDETNTGSGGNNGEGGGDGAAGSTTTSGGDESDAGVVEDGN